MQYSIFGIANTPIGLFFTQSKYQDFSNHSCNPLLSKHVKMSEKISKLTEELFKEIKDEECRLSKAKQDFINETKEFNIIKDKMSKICPKYSSKVKLNIGGKIFMTTVETLTREKDNFFSAMFSERFNTQL